MMTSSSSRKTVNNQNQSTVIFKQLESSYDRHSLAEYLASRNNTFFSDPLNDKGQTSIFI